MMKKILLLVFSFLLFVPGAAQADNPGQGPYESGGGTCDLTELKNSIASTESGNQGCTIQAAGDAGKHGAARGKYQFIADTWNRMAKGCPNANNCPHASLARAECCATQECAMDNLLLANKAAIEKNSACQSLLGKTVQSKKYGSCTATMSGLLAAWHLGGANACNGPANGTYGDCDNYGTCEADYICKHGGKPVPGDCKPTFDVDPSQAPPVGTLQQIESLEAQGEMVLVGSADGIKENWVAGLMLMAEQFTANMAAQVQAIGKLFDAKHQMETQRLFQKKMSEAHKDYHPSEQMCTFGTFARDLMATSRNADLAKQTLSHEIFQREIGAGDSKGMTGTSDKLSRLAHFRKNFCNPGDNANGLRYLCPKPAPAERQNLDIDYTRAIDMPLSLALDPTDDKVTPDEEAVFALIDNLFAHEPMPRPPAAAMDQRKYQYYYMNLRSLVALRGIARNSIASIIALKTATPNEAQKNESAAPFLKALFREFGLPDSEIEKLLGENPSYYAQMEILTKTMYQNPSFYTNLYDKPANVERIRAAMQAIKLMQDRDIQAALHRREMLLSIMLEIRLRERAENVYSAARGAMFEER